MNKSEYWNMIHTLYKKMHKVEGMTEAEACVYMDAESKSEGLAMIKDIIDAYRKIGMEQNII